MVYRVLADAVLLLHFGFLVYLVLGGFLAWRWPWAIVPHAVAALWGFLVVAASLDCPLTGAENYFRRLAGQPELSRNGFIDQYIEGVVYPERYTALVRVAVAAVVLTSWLGAGYLALSRRGNRRGLARRSVTAPSAPRRGWQTRGRRHDTV